MSPLHEGPSSRPTAGRRGFSLVELVMALAITSILLFAMGSALTMTLGAADLGKDSPQRAADAQRVLAQMQSDMTTATAWTEISPGVIAFLSPDRDSDGAAESISYTWSGKPGDSLKRTFNGVETPVLADVRAMNLSLITRRIPETYETPPGELIACNSPAGASTSFRSPDPSNMIAQYFRPTLPTGAVSWSISSISLSLSSDAAVDSNLRISIRRASANRQPTTTSLGLVLLAESSMPTSYGWVTVPIGPITGLGPTEGVCIVLQGGRSGSTSGKIQYVSGSSQQPYNSHMMTSADGGTSWTTPSDSQDLRFSVRGTVTISRERD